MTTNKTARWYLIQTKPRREARAEEHLRQHFECYRPLKASAATRSGQGAKAGEPLFPGYLFIRLDSTHDNWYPIRSTRGVNRVVSFGGQPTPVRDELIEQLRQRRPRTNVPLRPTSSPAKGAGQWRQLQRHRSHLRQQRWRGALRHPPQPAAAGTEGTGADRYLQCHS